MNRTVAATVALAIAAVVACTEPSTADGTTPTRSPSAPAGGASGWAADIDAFASQLEAIHPEPYHSIPREDFYAAVLDYKQRLPTMTEWEAATGFQRLLAFLTRSGRDGHMVLLPADRDGYPWEMFPIQLYWFPDGIYVVAARDEPELVGAELVRVGSTPVDQAIAVVKRHITKDNSMTVKARVPTFFEAPQLLTALGLMDAEARTLTFDVQGRTEDRELQTIPFAEHERWLGLIHPYVRRLPPRAGALFLRNQDQNVWMRYLTGSRTLYVAFNLVQPPFDGAVRAVERVLDTRDVGGVVLDLRHNPGGETGLYGPMLDVLDDARVDRPGRLFALTGRTTFSAAANFLADLDNSTCVMIVGEPPGAAPRFWNDNDAVALPYSGYEVGVATRWWGKGGERHPKPTFTMDIPVRYNSRHYFTGTDPVLRRALEHSGRGCP